MGPRKPTISLIGSTRRIRIVVADPYPVIVHGVRKMLEDDPRLQVVAEAFTLQSFQKKLIAQRPEVSLVDWYMASQDLALTTALLQSDVHPTSMVFLTVSENAPQKREMLKLGARAFLSKWCSAGKLRTAVLKACSDEEPPSAVDAAAVESVPGLAITEVEQRIKQLTHRERQLIPLVCRGLKNKEIARQLGIAESTVWHHLTAVFTKLRVADRMGLAAFAYAHVPAIPAAQTRPARNLGVLEAFPSRTPKYSPSGEGTGQRKRSLNALG
jgi:DNA-binding NarL/FixJ family response regulator